jgi:hypothetical protein
VTGGVVLVVLVGLMMALALLSATRLAARGQSFGVIYLIALAGACLFEVSLAFVDNTFVVPVMLLPLAAIVFSHELGGAAEPEPSQPEAAQPALVLDRAPFERTLTAAAPTR